MKTPSPIAFQALTAKLCDLADERGCRVTEVAELDELSAAARSLLTRAETGEVIHAEVERIGQDFLDEQVAAGNCAVDEHGVYRRTHEAS